MVLGVLINSILQMFLALVCLLLGVYVLVKSRPPLSVLYFCFTLVFFVTIFFLTLATFSLHPTFEYYMRALMIFWWLLFFALGLQIVMVFSEARFKQYILLYIPPLVVFMVYLFSEYFFPDQTVRYLGCVQVPIAWYVIYVVYYSVYALATLGYLVAVYFKAKEYFRRRVAAYMFTALTFVLLLGPILRLILYLLVRVVYPTTIYAMMGFLLIIGHSIVRYTPLDKVTEEEVAFEAAETLLDAVFLTDAGKRITYVNPAASRLTGYRLDEIYGTLIDHLFSARNDATFCCVRKDKTKVMVTQKVFVLEQGQGFVYLVHDLEPVLTLRASRKTINAELEKYIYRENTIKEYLLALLDVKDMKQFDYLQREISAADREIQLILCPVLDLVGNYVHLYEDAVKSNVELKNKTSELEYMNKIMAGREQILKDLIEQYERLSS